MVDCQGEGPQAGAETEGAEDATRPTVGVQLTLMESLLWKLIGRGAGEAARETVERIFEQAAGSKRYTPPMVGKALEQCIAAQRIADPDLSDQDLCLALSDLLNKILGEVKDGRKRVQLGVWLAARISVHVPTTFFEAANVVPLRRPSEG